MFTDGFWSKNGAAVMSRLIRARASVAVVGSSGNLLFHGHGNEIDRHDVVIRVNGAVIQGYQKDVGSRTDVLVAWSRGVDEARRSKQLYKNLTVVYTCTDYFPDDCHWTDAEEYEGVRHALVLSNEWVHWVHQNTMGKAGNWPSTGFATMILAMTLAKASGAQPPTVYGFGACLNCTKYCDCDGSNSTDADRAFDELGEKKAIDGASWHAFGTEAELRRRFAADNLIQLREPGCQGLYHAVNRRIWVYRRGDIPPDPLYGTLSYPPPRPHTDDLPPPPPPPSLPPPPPPPPPTPRPPWRQHLWPKLSPRPPSSPSATTTLPPGPAAAIAPIVSSSSFAVLMGLAFAFSFFWWVKSAQLAPPAATARAQPFQPVELHRRQRLRENGATCTPCDRRNGGGRHADEQGCSIPILGENEECCVEL